MRILILCFGVLSLSSCAMLPSFLTEVAKDAEVVAEFIEKENETLKKPIDMKDPVSATKKSVVKA